MEAKPQPTMLPLQLATCEVRFPGDPAVEVGRAEFFQRIRDDYPTLRVPKAAAGEAPALQPYRFDSGDGGRWVGLAVNSLSYATKGPHYGSFDDFAGVFLNVLHELVEIVPSVSASGLTRVGLRYQNHLPVRRDADGGVLEMPLDLANLSLGRETLANVLHVAEYVTPNGKMRVIIDTTQEGIAPLAALFDVDVMVDRDLDQTIPIDDVDGVLHLAHSDVKATLSNLLNGDYAEEVGLL